MKIMIVNSFYYPEIMGGAEISTKKLAEGLIRGGEQVRVLCTGKEYKKEHVDGVEVVRIPTRNVCRRSDDKTNSKMKKAIRTIQDLWNPLNAKMIVSAIDEYQPDIIHTNCLYDISTVVWKVAKKRGIRIVHTIRDYHLCCPLSTFSCQTGEKCTMPKLYCSIHSQINKMETKRVDFVTAPSKMTLNIACNAGLFKNTNSAVVANATDFTTVEVQKILKQKLARASDTQSEIRFVYLGSLTEQKGIRWLIEEFVRINRSNCSLYIAGKGNLLDYVKKKSNELPQIHYCGFLNENEVDDLLNNADVLICPSKWNEPFGRVVLDAYKHAMPAIVSGYGALPELVKQDKTGAIVHAEEPNSLGEAMEEYVDDENRVNEQRRNAAKEIEEYSIDKQIEAFRSIYKKIV